MSKVKRRPNPAKVAEKQASPRKLDPSLLGRVETAVNSKPHLHGDNDKTWYTRLQRLAEDSASLSYSVIPGITRRIHAPRGTTVSDLNVAGIMQLGFQPTIGRAADANSPINVTAKALYAYIRSNISGSRNYEPNDVIIYDLALDSAFYLWTAATRAYGLLNRWSVFNRYTPDVLVEACGFNAVELRGNMPRFRSIINTFAAKLSALSIPASMSYNTRHAWMCANVFLDASSPKAQYYVYKPTGYYVYNEATDHGSELVYKNLPAILGIDDLDNVFNEIINALLGSEDIGTISGDIYRAFGGPNVFQMSQIPEDYDCIPRHSWEVLSQIENADILLGAVPGTIVQRNGINEGYITQRVTTNLQQLYINGAPGGLYADKRVFGLDKILNMHIDNPDYADNLVATRLMVGISNIPEIIAGQTGDNTTLDIDILGSEIIVHGRIFILGDTELGNYNIATSMCVPNQVTVGQALSYLQDWMSFDWAPKIYMSGDTSEMADAVSQHFERPMFDYDNYTTFDLETLKGMHEAAMLSLFYVDLPNFQV
nr:putative capsid [Marmot picobirnavirus]